jgi:hypothetical protein
LNSLASKTSSCTANDDMRSKSTFPSPKRIAAWLKSHPDGQKLFEELLAERCTWCLQRPRVLVVTDGCGRVEVNHDPSVYVRFEQKLFVRGSEAERLAEEELELRLPSYWRDLYCPQKAKTWRDSRMTPSMAADAAWQLEMIEALKEIGADPMLKPLEVTW